MFLRLFSSAHIIAPLTEKKFPYLPLLGDDDGHDDLVLAHVWTPCQYIWCQSTEEEEMT